MSCRHLDYTEFNWIKQHGAKRGLPSCVFFARHVRVYSWMWPSREKRRRELNADEIWKVRIVSLKDGICVSPATMERRDILFLELFSKRNWKASAITSAALRAKLIQWQDVLYLDKWALYQWFFFFFLNVKNQCGIIKSQEGHAGWDSLMGNFHYWEREKKKKKRRQRKNNRFS